MGRLTSSAAVSDRNYELTHVSAYAPGFVIASQHFDGVSSRQQSVAGIVFDGTLDKLGGGFAAQLDIHLIANVLDGGSVLVLDFADEIDHRALGAAAARQRQLAARNLHHH